MREFCSKLSVALLPERSENGQAKARKAPDQKAFARHTIFGNPTFAREVMENLWKTEFACRVKTIQERAKLLPYDQQASMLKTYLATMDEWILGLPIAEVPKTKAESEKEPEAEIQEMFAGLLAHRVKNGEDRRGLAKYQIENITFKSKIFDTATNMANAFKFLDDRGDNCGVDMLDEIRKPYLQNLGNMDVPPFEVEYMSLHDYLTDAPKNSDQVKTKFVEEMQTLGAAVLDYCIIADEPWKKHSWIKSKHAETMLSVAAIRNVNQYRALIEQIRDYQMMRLANRTARNEAVGAIRAEIRELQSLVSHDAGSEDEAIWDVIKLVLGKAEQTLQSSALIWQAQKDGPRLSDISKSFVEYFESYGPWLGYAENPVGSKDEMESTAKLFAKKQMKR